MQYKVITEGTGATPKSNDVVLVNYHGRLINGKEFDSSTKRGDKPAKFPVGRVVRGWTEALQMMKVGSKWEIYIPPSLAYGDRGSGPIIEPGSTLVFDMELVGIETPPAPAAPAARATPAAPAAPLTSDVIKVPSAEELKKGAKIEVIKAEDLEKMTNAAAQKPAQKYSNFRLLGLFLCPSPLGRSARPVGLARGCISLLHRSCLPRRAAPCRCPY